MEKPRAPHARAREGSRAFGCQAMDGLSAEPVRPQRTLAFRRGRGAEGAFFFGYFLLGKQKKVTGRQDGGRNTHGRESAIAQRRTATSKWIPASAGMTSRDDSHPRSSVHRASNPLA